MLRATLRPGLFGLPARAEHSPPAARARRTTIFTTPPRVTQRAPVATTTTASHLPTDLLTSILTHVWRTDPRAPTLARVSHAWHEATSLASEMLKSEYVAPPRMPIYGASPPPALQLTPFTAAELDQLAHIQVLMESIPYKIDIRRTCALRSCHFVAKLTPHDTLQSNMIDTARVRSPYTFTGQHRRVPKRH